MSPLDGIQRENIKITDVKMTILSYRLVKLAIFSLWVLVLTACNGGQADGPEQVAIISLDQPPDPDLSAGRLV